MPRAGIVTVAGKPNVGKSTLLNRIVGQKLSITSPKPQSTRDRIVGIYTTDDTQLVILDTPGLLNPKYPLQQAMRSTAVRALDEADVIIYLADATEGPPPSLAEAAELSTPPKAPVIIALNKSDALTRPQREQLALGDDVVLISALTGDGIPDLMARIAQRLAECHREKRFDALHVVAAPRLLGYLRKALNGDNGQDVIRTVRAAGYAMDTSES